MRDPELLISMLREMSEQEGGFIAAPLVYGDQGEDLRRHHHADLLNDVGHAEWTSDSVIRITSQGYDFIHAIDNQPEAKAKFLDLFGKGMDYLHAAIRAIELASKAAGTS